jgi:signal transduction histidine kinase
VPGPVEPRRCAALPPLAPEAAAAVLAPPRLPADAAAALPRALAAAAAGLPVTLVAPRGARVALARALHARAGRPGPLLVAAARRPALAALPAGATVLLDVARLAPETLSAVEALVDDGAVWVLAWVVPGEAPPAALAHRLAAATLVVRPLAERPADVPALADALLAAHAPRLGRALAFTPAARARLARHPWPGDVAELEGVVARAALAAGDAPVDEEHLGLRAPEAEPDTADPQLELLLAELAHELRNPLVTIKTYADHLPDMLEDAELRARFAALAGEGIARMDGLLENLLAFARLRAPRPGPVEVQPLLDRALADVGPELAERAVTVHRAGDGGARCAGDPEHLAYAFRNLVAGIVREVPAREELALETTTNGVVTIRFASGAASADRLRRLVAPNGGGALGDPTLLPLSFRLARDVLARNGGGLTLEERPGAGTTLVVQLPATREETR